MISEQKRKVNLTAGVLRCFYMQEDWISEHEG